MNVSTKASMRLGLGKEHSAVAYLHHTHAQLVVVLGQHGLRVQRVELSGGVRASNHAPVIELWSCSVLDSVMECYRVL